MEEHFDSDNDQLLSQEFAYDEYLPLVSTPKFTKTPEVPLAPKTASSSFLFRGCCSTSTVVVTGESWTIETPRKCELKDSASPPNLIVQLMVAETKSIRLVEQARQKRQDLMERAKEEAIKEASIYENRFKTEFSKIEDQHNKTLETLEQSSQHHLEGQLAKDKKKARKNIHATTTYVLENVCKIHLGLDETTIASIRKEDQKKNLFQHTLKKNQQRKKKKIHFTDDHHC